MKKLILVGLIGAVAVLAVAKKTSVCSYVETIWAQAEKGAKEQIPTELELERLDREIARLDDKINEVLSEGDEYRVGIRKLKKDIDEWQTKILVQEKDLVAAIDDLKDNPKEVRYGNTTYPASAVRQQIVRNSTSIDKSKEDVKMMKLRLEKNEEALRKIDEQAAKIQTQKQIFKSELDDLKVLHQTLKLARIASDVKIDNGQETQIKTSIAELKQRLEVGLETARRKTGDIVPIHERPQTPLDLQAIRNKHAGESTEKTVSNK